MRIEDLNSDQISKIISQQVEQVSCSECCKYYRVPKTASCGHSLCHGCWMGRNTCFSCSDTINKKTLKVNIPLQILTEKIHALADAYEKIFNVKLDELDMDLPEAFGCNDPTNNVKQWLASSQNHFSGPVSLQLSEQELLQSVQFSKSKVQIHNNTKKNESSEKIVLKPQIQDDWDKIEVLPDTEEIIEKHRHNVAGPMDIENFFVEENIYSTDNPRRSSRKKELKPEYKPSAQDASIDNNTEKNSSSNTETKSVKNKQTWSNVKKMRKEFSKLNKKNKNKLNVSIEMCKKGQDLKKKQKQNLDFGNLEPVCINIDENTPDIENKIIPLKSVEETKLHTNTDENNHHDSDNKNKNKQNNINNVSLSNECDIMEPQNIHQEVANSESNVIAHDLQNDNIDRSALPFTKKGPLCKSNNNNIKDSKVHVSLSNECNIIEPQNIHQKMANDQSNENLTHDLQNGNINKSALPFIKKGPLCKSNKEIIEGNEVQITQKEINNIVTKEGNDDIEISIKIGTTVTNIVIKNKRSDVKINTDKGIQTSLGPHNIELSKKNATCSPLVTSNVQNIELNIEKGNKVTVKKTLSAKKNTASADTATAHFEATNSEKQLPDVMKCAITKNRSVGATQSILNPNPEIVKDPKVVQLKNSDYEDIGDIDLFNSGSVKEANVKPLQDTKTACSEIFVPTIKSKKSYIACKESTSMDVDDIELPSAKRQKLEVENEKQPKSNELANDSESMNYDAILSQAFANIDADMEKNQNDNNTFISKTKLNKGSDLQKESQCHQSQILQNSRSLYQNLVTTQQKNEEIINQKCSENLFSILEKDSETLNTSEKNRNKHCVKTSTQQQIDNLLTPGMCREMEVETGTQDDLNIEMKAADPFVGTPVVDNYDSDKSIVEETPQKNQSVTKVKHNNENMISVNSTKTKILQLATDNQTSDSQIIRSIIDISDTTEDTVRKGKDVTVIDAEMNKDALQTPLTIKKFVNHITHKSTPLARKSLHFQNDNLEDADPEQTLCATTTQEKEFLIKAFEQTPKSPVRKPLALRNMSMKHKKLFVAGSCLTSFEVSNLKALCSKRGWTYLDKYTDDLTHLVVGVDDENRSQRSVKYICALAGAKWIVTYKWAEQCILRDKVLDESPYEALDATGEPGPRRSRKAMSKVFDGITFYCMPPFSVLNLDVLKSVLRVAGGTVVNDRAGVMTDKCSSPCLLIAEPEHTQEDRFIYLAMEHKIVPVNYEWILNCLCTYTLCSIQDLLLCPSSLLPPETKNWPSILIQQVEDEE